MKSKFYLAALAAAALAACDRVCPVENDEHVEMVRLGVTIPDSETKVSGITDEAAVRNVQVLVFDRTTGALENYGISSTKTIVLDCVPGQKTIVALANAPDVSGMKSYSELTATASLLSDNKIGALVMEGSMDITLAKSTDITIPLSRIAAKVELTDIANQMSLEYNKDKDFSVISIYLINAAGDRNYLSGSTPKVWYNKMKYEAGSPDILYDSLGGKMIDDGKAYETAHYFYCYPNATETDKNNGEWSERHTRLVVEATLGGTRCFYPVTLPTLLNNTIYRVSLTVTRPGSSSPDDPLDIESGKFSVEVVDWRNGKVINEVI
jgi:hypothetical protein